MKKTIGKRIVAILLTLCMMISIATMSVTTSSAGSLTNFAINRLYTSGLLFAGKVVNKIAQATDVEEIEALGSFIYIWVCGGNNNASDIAEVNALCEEILAEVYRVETKLDSYSSTLGQMQANLAFDTLLNDMNATFKNDVTGKFGELSDPTSLSHAFLKYFNSEDLEKLSDDKQELLKEDASYLVSCYMYKNEIADENGELFTLEEIENKRESLLYAFCGVRGIDVTKFMDVNGILDEEGLLDALFAESTTTNPDIDATVRSVMESLTNNLVKSSNDSYADLCAQVAYAAFPSLSDQYEYIMSNISKQFMAICLTEMMYQEYLSIRGEYLETYHNQDTDTDKALWSEYQWDISGNEKDSYDGFDDYNRRALDSMELRLSTSLKLDTAMFMSLDDYVRNEDTQGIVLYDNNYYNWTTVDEISMEYMPADMLTTLTRSNGVEVYYMLSGDKNGSHNAFPLSCLVRYTDLIGADRYEVTSEVRNFMQNPYSDSHNTYECAVTPENVATLFQTPSFALYGSSPYSYLGKYYADDDVQYNMVYQLLDYTDRMTINGDKDERDVYKGVNMKGSYFGYDPNAVDTYYLDAKSIYTNGYTDRDNDTDYATNENVYNQGFSVILYNTSDTFKKSLSCTVNGDGDMYITDSQGNIISSGSSIVSGTDLQIHIKPIDNALIPSSLKLNRYNNTQHPDTVTNTVEIMNTADDFYPLNTDSNGYYVLDFSMPYSNAELVLETEPYKMSTDTNGNFIIESYDDLLVMSDKVNAGIEEYVDGSYVVTNDIIVPEGEMWTNPIGQYPNFFEGSFDGQGYTISGLAFEGSTDKEGFGLFDITFQATIKNVNLDVNFNLHCSEGYAVQRVAGLCAGASYNTDISNCTVRGNILVTADSGYQPKYVGGVCGMLESKYGIEKCINYCNVDANAHCVGGVCGYATNSAQIINCANTASVKAYQLNPDGILKQPENCAGIIGETQGNASVTNCYNTGVISGDSSNSSIVSLCVGKRPVNCYYLDTCAEDEYATAKSIEQFNSGEVTYLLNNGVTDSTQVWYQNVDYKEPFDLYPHFDKTENNTVYFDESVYTNKKPYSLEVDENGNFVITSYDDLLVISKKVNAGVSQYVSGNYVLANDITVPENEYWNTPIGTSTSKFSGSFDGQGYKIIGLKSNKPAEYNPDSVVDNTNMGLFGWVKGAQFKNICLEDVNFSLDDAYSVAYVGALCARAQGDNTFSKCIASGTMNFNEASNVGGLIGVASAGKNNITNCANQIDLTVTSGYICGGIVGSCDSGATLTNCYNVGEINGSFNNCTVIKGAGGKAVNCYVLDNNNYMIYSGTTECTIEQFNSGEVTHLLNSNVGISEWAWFQNIDNGKTPDKFPTLTFTRDNVVFKVNREDETYSNIPNDYLLGDADLDGEINVMDATLIQLHCAKRYELTGVALVNADTLKDNIISISDATKIQAYIARVIEEL